MIKVENLCSGYDKQEKLHHVTCQFPSQKITAIIGPNGCGKSTLLKTICGILPSTSGTVAIQDTAIHHYTATQLAQRVAYLPQNRNIPTITVEKMVLHGRFPYLSCPRKYTKNDIEIAKLAMEKAGVLAHKNKNLNTLSGGERQKVYIAMALAQDTPIILLDEPTTYLDIYHQLDVMRTIQELKKQQKTVVVVLHDLNMALRFADHIMVMNQGVLVQSDLPEKIANSTVFSSVFGVEISAVTDCENQVNYSFRL